MKRLCTLLIASSLMLAAAGDIGDPKSEILPSMPSAEMRLGWNDFLKLVEMVEQSRALEEKLTAREAEKPPWSWTISRAAYTAEASPGGQVDISALLELRVLEEGWSTIPVVGVETALSEALLDGEPALLRERDGWYALAVKEPGLHTLGLTFHVRSKEEKGRRSFSFKAAQAAERTMTVRVEAGAKAVGSPQAASIRLEKSPDSVVARLVLDNSPDVAVFWDLPVIAPSPPKKKEAKTPPPPPKPPLRFTCRTLTSAIVSRDMLSCESRLHFDILQGETRGFSLSLPGDAEVLNAQHEGVELSVEPAEKRQRLQLGVNHVLNKDFDFTLRYTVPIPSDAASAAVPPLAVEEALRHEGAVAIAVDGNILVDAEAAGEDLRRTDPAQIPLTLRSAVEQPILHAFEFSKAPWLLALHLKRLEDVPVLTTAIDAAEFTTGATEEGRFFTSAAYTVRNNMQQFLTLHLPRGAEVWSAAVEGVPTKPAYGEQEGDVLVRLPRTGVEGTTHVQVVYVQQRKQPLEGLDAFALEPPKVDFLINRATWRLHLPPEHSLWRSAGDFKPVQIVRFKDAGVPRSKMSWGEQRSLMQLREGVERFFITDINNPAASVQAQHKEYADVSDAKPPEAPAQKARTAGVLPVNAQLPISGEPFAFARGLIEEGQSPRLVIYTIPESLRSAGSTAAVVAGALLGGLLAALVLWRRRKLLLILGMAVCVGVLIWLYAAGLATPTGPLAAGMLAAAAVLALWLIARNRGVPAKQGAAS